MKEYEISLSTNDKAVKLDGFPRDFLIKVLIGASSSLKGVSDIDSLGLTMRFGKVKMAINGVPISLGPFPTLIMGKTLIAIVSTLKGVDGEVSNLEIKLEPKIKV